MKKVLSLLVSSSMAIILQVVLVNKFYPWIFDEALGKNKLVTFGTYGTAIFGIIVVIVCEIIRLHETSAECITLRDLLCSLVRVVVVSAVSFVVCLIILLILDFIWYVFDNIVAVIMGGLVLLIMVGVLVGAFDSETWGIIIFREK